MHAIILAFMAAHADQINGAIEIGGSLFVFNSCRILLHDKLVKGVSALTVGFFFTWGVWNTIWYPYLHQPLSFAGGALMALANLTNVCMMVYYKYIYKPKTEKRIQGTELPHVTAVREVLEKFKRK